MGSFHYNFKTKPHTVIPPSPGTIRVVNGTATQITVGGGSSCTVKLTQTATLNGLATTGTATKFPQDSYGVDSTYR